MRACVCVHARACTRAHTHTHTHTHTSAWGRARLPKGTLRMLCTSISAKLHTRPQSLGRWHAGAAWRSLHTRSESGGPMAGAQALVGDLGAGQGGHLGTLPKPTRAFVLHSPSDSAAPLLVSFLLHGGHSKGPTGQKSRRQGRCRA